jgi:very-short-patch-repair endonuclease
LAALAARQYGVVSRSQLTRLGFSKGAIGDRLVRKRLQVVHRGVYAVGHRVLTQHGRWMAALLAIPDSVLSHHSAADLWGLRDRSPDRTDVLAPARHRRQVGLTCHTGPFDPDETTRRHRIPVTTVARTLFDLAGVIGRDRLERAFDRAQLAHRLDPAAVDSLLARHPRRHGAATLRAVVAGRDTKVPLTRSEFEDRFPALIRRARLPRPRVNALINGLEVDFAWPDHHLIVELDGYAHHGGDGALERDRARDRSLVTDGWQVVRITWRQVQASPAEVLRDLRRLLA